jgi:hypothetical protein
VAPDPLVASAVIQQAPDPQGLAVYTRLQKLLSGQQDKLRSYLAVLHKQRDAIEQDRAGDVTFYTEFADTIGRDILAVQKVILPLEAMGRREEPDILALKGSLEELSRQVATGLEQNKELLAGRMAALRSELDALKGSPMGRTSVYAWAGTPSFIDIQL